MRSRVWCSLRCAGSVAPSRDPQPPRQAQRAAVAHAQAPALVEQAAGGVEPARADQHGAQVVGVESARLSIRQRGHEGGHFVCRQLAREVEQAMKAECRRRRRRARTRNACHVERRDAHAVAVLEQLAVDQADRFVLGMRDRHAGSSSASSSLRERSEKPPLPTARSAGVAAQRRAEIVVVQERRVPAGRRRARSRPIAPPADATCCTWGASPRSMKLRVGRDRVDRDRSMIRMPSAASAPTTHSVNSSTSAKRICARQRCSAAQGARGRARVDAASASRRAAAIGAA